MIGASVERSSEDSVSDMGKGAKNNTSDQVKKEDNQEIKEAVANLEIIDESEKYDDPFQSTPANLKYAFLISIYRTIVLSLIFIVLVATEFGGPGIGNFTGQSQVKQLMTKIIDYESVFDERETSRLEINSPE